MTNAELYRLTLDAEREWIDAIRAKHGPKSYPASRYDARGVSTPHLVALCKRWQLLCGYVLEGLVEHL